MTEVYYEYVVNGATCKVYSSQSGYVGKVWIDALGETNFVYAERIHYFPHHIALEYLEEDNKTFEKFVVT